MSRPSRSYARDSRPQSSSGPRSADAKRPYSGDRRGGASSGRQGSSARTEFALPESTTPALPAVEAFSELDMPAPLLTALAEQGLTTPFPIQAVTLPNSLAGRDVLGRGRTGSGKTHRLRPGPAGPHRRPPRRAPPAAGADPGPDPGAGPAGHRRAHPLRPRGPAPDGDRRGRDVHRPPGARAARRRRDRRGYPGTPEGPHRARRLPPGPGRRSPSWTRPTRWPTWASCRRSPSCLDQVAPGGQPMLFSATLDRNVDRLVRRYLTDPVAHSVDPSAATVTHDGAPRAARAGRRQARARPPRSPPATAG